MTYLLDTDHVSVLQRPDGKGFAELTRRIGEVGEDEIALCVVSLHEQTVGCHAYINRARSQADVTRGYAMLGRVLDAFVSAAVLSFDAAAAQSFDEFASRRLQVGTLDLRIAAVALSRGLILLTRNTSDFKRVPGLRIENWTE